MQLSCEYLHSPAKFFAQNVFCILMSDSDVFLASDFKIHIRFSPSHRVFSLSTIYCLVIWINLTIKINTFRTWSVYRLYLEIFCHMEHNFYSLKLLNELLLEIEAF